MTRSKVALALPIQHMGWVFDQGELRFLLDLFDIRSAFPPLSETTCEDVERLEADDLLLFSEVSAKDGSVWRVEEFLGRFLRVMGKTQQSMMLFQGDAWICVRSAMPLIGVCVCLQQELVHLFPAERIDTACEMIQDCLRAYNDHQWRVLNLSDVTQYVAKKNVSAYIKAWLTNLLED